MSNREVVIDLVKKMPEDASLHEFAREIELLTGLQTAREEAQRGEGIIITAEDAEWQAGAYLQFLRDDSAEDAIYDTLR